ncbi:MAG TPA: hypothetical protein VIN08_06675 [Ohtaekwangia sp.]|uniref:hypothetical protein n=1 Tax=Ohtaekwangia sp. TaxID=2066019 RepID=UPI002F930743
MKKSIGIILSVTLLSINYHALAQSYAESALLFGRTQPAGSARILGLGGTQIALGGDYSSALSNPAGLGMYNRSEFTFTPALTFYNTQATLNGSSNEESLSKFNIPGFSLVLNMKRDTDGDFKGGSFGISYSRINDFNNSTIYSGHNTTSSIVDYFMEQANGDNTSQFDQDQYQYNTPTGLAYYNYLIGPSTLLDPPGSETEYFTDAPIESDQHEEITTKGRSYQWNFSYGANYKDLIFFGGGLGITTLHYETQKVYSEAYSSDVINNMQLSEDLNVRGNGVNVTLGAIARPLNFLQVGLSFTSPTYYQLTETYNASMSSSWKNYDYWDGSQNVRLNNESASTDEITSDYSLTTPLKLSAGIALISKYGFISADIERTNPAKSRYSSNVTDVSFSSDNDEIKSLYKAVFNYRIGAELRYNIFRLRGGYNIQSNTFQNSNYSNKIESISGGVGVKLKKFFADFALINRKASNYYSPYTLADGSEPVVSITNKTTTSMITFGFTF